MDVVLSRRELLGASLVATLAALSRHADAADPIAPLPLGLFVATVGDVPGG